MNESESLMIEFSKIQYRINSNDKKPRNFGTKHALYQSEIHFIDAIEPGDGIIASQVAQKLGVTKGAVTQIADKLVKKGLIEKYKRPDNKKEVYIKLTSDGKIAYDRHRLFHKQLGDKMIAYLDSLSPAQMQALTGLLNIIDKNLPDLNKETSS